MIQQVIEKRKSRIVDEGTMGFHDYEERFEMSFEEFVNAVTKKYSREDIKLISISYPNIREAVVVFEEKDNWKEVSFDEVLKIDKLAKCEHSLLKNSKENYGIDLTESMLFNQFLKQIATHFSPVNCKRILAQARWFIIDEEKAGE